MYLIPIAKASDTREMSASKDPRMISSGQVSKKQNPDQGNLKESTTREPVPDFGALHCGVSNFQEETRPFTSRAISSQKYYNEYGWGINSTAGRRHDETYEPRRMEPYIPASRKYLCNQNNMESIDVLKHGYRKHVTDRERKSPELSGSSYLDARLQSPSSTKEWEDKLERSNINTSSDKGQLISSMKTTSPRRRPGQSRSSKFAQNGHSFVDTNPQHQFQSYAHTMERQSSKHPNGNSNEPDQISSKYAGKGSWREQRAPWMQQSEPMESSVGGSGGKRWCSGEERLAQESGSPRLTMKQRWKVKPRLGRPQASPCPNWNTGSRTSVEMKTMANKKRGGGGKSRQSWRTSHCNTDGRMTDKIKSRKEYALASQPSIGCQRTTKGRRQRQFSGEQQVRFHRNSRSKTTVINGEYVKFSSEPVSRPSLKMFKTSRTYDPVAARLRQRSVKLSNMNDSDSGTGSSDYDDDNEDSTSQPSAPDHKISIKLPTISRRERVNRPLATINNDETPDACCIQLDKLIKIETNNHLGEVLMTEKENLHAAELKKATQYVITRKLPHKKEIPLTPHFRQTNVHHPCYIADNVGQIMSFLSLIEIMKAKRVSKTWEIAANSTLRRRKVDNLTISPPLTAEAGSMMLSQVHIFLPRLQCLTISINDFKHLRGLVLSYICECKNLLFLRVENLAWRDLTIATQVILSLRDPGNHGHPILNNLRDLELPDSRLPIPTSTQCIRPLSKLAPNLRSLTVKSAQDPIIFSLRLFFPTVRNLFLLDTLWTTRRFAQIISSSPHLMKFLMDGQKVRMLTPMVTGGSGMHISTPVSSSPSDRTSVPHTPRIHSSGSVPVTPSDDRLTPLISNHKESLYVEPLGRVKQIETGKDLTKANIGMFAGFCALIGVLIIMPPMDGQG